MCHSMGNYVLQGLDQSHRDNNNDDCAPVFDHIFMVAADDVRQDIFDTALNDSNNSSQRTLIPRPTSFQTGLSIQAESRLAADPTNSSAVGPHFDFMTNAGRDIAALARSKVHVLYSNTDIALTYRTYLYRHNFMPVLYRNLFFRMPHLVRWSVRNHGDLSVPKRFPPTRPWVPTRIDPIGFVRTVS